MSCRMLSSVAGIGLSWGVSGHPSGGKPPLLKIKRQLSAYRLVSDVKKSFFFFFYLEEVHLRF